MYICISVTLCICKGLHSILSIMLPNCCLHPQALEICSKIYQNSLKREFSLLSLGVFFFFPFLLFIKSVEEYHKQLMQMSHQGLISHCFWVLA